MTVGVTPRLGLTSWSADTDQVDRAQFAATLTALDGQCMPDFVDFAANIGNYTPGAGYWFHALDTSTDYVGTGSAWEALLHRVDTTVTSGTLPTGSSVNKGEYYWTSDTLQLYRSNGASMIVVEDAINVPPPQPPPVGTIITLLPSASVNASPATWLPCNGASLSTTAYPSLFSLIGYEYGGSGGHFNLPNIGGFQGSGRPLELTEPGAPASAVFSYTGGLQTWTAPSNGVWGGSVQCTVIGGGGGGSSGGYGASVSGLLSGVTGSGVIDVYVGGQGGTITDSSQSGRVYGYHQGGAPYDLNGGPINATLGFGGSSSAVTYGSAVLEAGGGGGQGYYYGTDSAGTSQTFSYTGGSQSFTTPSAFGGLLSITAQGGGGGGSSGGEGAIVQASFPGIAASESWTIYVGGQGSSANDSTNGSNVFGYHQGGQAQPVDSYWNNYGATAGWGGSSSAVTYSSTLYVEAGAGGGEGWLWEENAQSQQFDATGGTQTFTVPAAGVVGGCVYVVMYGGTGGPVGATNGTVYGGYGTGANAIVNVSAGETLTLYVGSAGQQGYSDYNGSPSPAITSEPQGGWGYGNGGNGAWAGSSYSNLCSAGGGGGSALVSSGTPLLVCGGGGGVGSDGGSGGSPPANAYGGNGGATTGGTGYPGATDSYYGMYSNGGTGGSPSGPGTGGSAGDSDTGVAAYGQNGSGTNGGNAVNPGGGSGGQGGGGGGGYYGGGAGGAAAGPGLLISGGGGGAGGSYASGSVQSVGWTYQDGYADGYIAIYWVPITTSPTSASAEGGGAGGTPTGGSGATSAYGGGSAGGGGGASQSGGGVGGSGQTNNGQSGSLGGGANTVNGGGWDGIGGGGGGGGGYAGGGMGALSDYHNAPNTYGAFLMGGGGGGSSYYGSGAQNTAYSNAGSLGNGSVKIAWVPFSSPDRNAALTGGNGGTSSGTAGTSYSYSSSYGDGGAGATSSAAGAGGAYETVLGGVTSTGSGPAGIAGGSANSRNGGEPYGGSTGGGGGGGGACGGGAGGQGTFNNGTNANIAFGAGGGGSSYATGFTNVGYATEGSSAAGQVIIQYTQIAYYFPASAYLAYIRAA